MRQVCVRDKKIRQKQKGFTLIEMMTILVILGVVLSIGVPKYYRVQVKAEWDADEIMIENMAKAAEVYAAQKHCYEPVPLKKLITTNIIDGNLVLNRINAKHIPGGEENVSLKNTTEISLYQLCPDDDDLLFEFNLETESGRVTSESFEKIRLELIGAKID